MPIKSRGVVGIALLVTAPLPGCAPGPFTRAVSAYASADLDATTALSKVPQTAYGICLTRAQNAYIQVRLGVSSTPEPIPWNKWFESAKATDKQAWREYCASVRSSAVLFAHAIGALRQYGVALQALADGGVYDGSDLQGTATSASGIAVSLDATGPAGAMRPVGNTVGKFSTFLFADYTDDQIETYVRRADPLVQELTGGLQRYVAAVEEEQRLAEGAQRQTLLALEVRGDLVEPPVDPAKLITFLGFARETEAGIEDTRAVLVGYRRVAARLAVAHGLMIKAAERGDKLEIKAALGSIFDLLTELQSLNTALRKE